jgi:hypothetical protein
VMRDIARGKTAKDEKTKFQGRRIVRGGDIAANRVHALLSKMFQLAEDWKFRPAGSNPCRAAKCCKQRLLWGRGARASCFDERADHGPLSAGERRAADRNRRDRVELHSEADESSIARRIDGHNDLAGYSGAQAADA